MVPLHEAIQCQSNKFIQLSPAFHDFSIWFCWYHRCGLTWIHCEVNAFQSLHIMQVPPADTLQTPFRHWNLKKPETFWHVLARLKAQLAILAITESLLAIFPISDISMTHCQLSHLWASRPIRCHLRGSIFYLVIGSGSWRLVGIDEIPNFWQCFSSQAALESQKVKTI